MMVSHLKHRICETNPDKEVRILNRYLRYLDKGPIAVELEADPRHAELGIRQLGLTGAKPVTTPGIKHSFEEMYKTLDEPPLSEEETTLYRSITMRWAYLGLDRDDIQYSIKECARHMKAPNKFHLQMLKRIGRYLIGHPRYIQQFRRTSDSGAVRVYTDSNHAGKAPPARCARPSATPWRPP